MATILNTFQTQQNYWLTNPSHLLLKPFKELHDRDTSADKEKSSRVMWAIALLVDTYPRSNPFRNLSEKERLALIERDYLGASLKEFDSLIKVYKKVCMTPLQRMLNEFSVKMDQRSIMLETNDYMACFQNYILLHLGLKKPHNSVSYLINQELPSSQNLY